jgi:membrane protein DedA with SNARE-associated domain
MRYQPVIRAAIAYAKGADEDSFLHTLRAAAGAEIMALSVFFMLAFLGDVAWSETANKLVSGFLAIVMALLGMAGFHLMVWPKRRAPKAPGRPRGWTNPPWRSPRLGS